ncbi:MAG: hypothetical protein ABI053_06790 [Lacisediminihabitans sp.]
MGNSQNGDAAGMGEDAGSARGEDAGSSTAEDAGGLQTGRGCWRVADA